MENKNKEKQVLNMLGLARRANKLITGQELVLSAIRANKAQIVFMARSEEHTSELQSR